MADFRDTIRALPRAPWTEDEIYFVGTVRDTHGLITVTFKRGSVVQVVKVKGDVLADAVTQANLKR